MTVLLFPIVALGHPFLGLFNHHSMFNNTVSGFKKKIMGS